MAMSKEQAKRRGYRPWINLCAGVCFLIFSSVIAYLAASRSKPDVVYWFVAIIFFLTSILQFSVYLYLKKRGVSH